MRKLRIAIKYPDPPGKPEGAFSYGQTDVVLEPSVLTEIMHAAGARSAMHIRQAKSCLHQEAAQYQHTLANQLYRAGHAMGLLAVALLEDTACPADITVEVVK